jgi:hypothetical protein
MCYLEAWGLGCQRRRCSLGSALGERLPHGKIDTIVTKAIINTWDISHHGSGFWDRTVNSQVDIYQHSGEICCHHLSHEAAQNLYFLWVNWYLAFLFTLFLFCTSLAQKFSFIPSFCGCHLLCTCTTRDLHSWFPTYATATSRHLEQLFETGVCTSGSILQHVELWYSKLVLEFFAPVSGMYFQLMNW